jgi:hypothetical protein
MATVFVTQETPHNFSPAEQFGTIEFVTRSDLNNVRSSLHNAKLVTDITRKLKDFDESRDWIVIAGSPYISALVFLILGRRGVKDVNVLRWDNRDFVYQPMVIEARGTYRE